VVWVVCWCAGSVFSFPAGWGFQCGVALYVQFSVLGFQFLVLPLIYIIITAYYSELYLSRMCGADCCWYGGQRGCVCVCCYLWTGFGFLSFVEAVFSIGGLRLWEGEGGWGFYGWWVFKRVSKIALGNMVCSSLGDCLL
jgi:hypothetical protein